LPASGRCCLRCLPPTETTSSARCETQQ
jgi:hypothetical protein